MKCNGTTQSGKNCKRLCKQGAFCHQHSLSTTKSNSLYSRLGGIFAIAAVVNRFSDQILKNRLVGVDSPNPQLREWSRKQKDRLPGLKWMRTLWVCDVSGGPYKYVGTHPDKDRLGLGCAHAKFDITSEEFDAVAGELKAALDYYKVPNKEQEEVLGAFAAHKKEVIESD